MRLTAPSFCLCFCLLLAMGLLGGCGLKPTKMEAPAGADPYAFPKVYPDPKNDPQPERRDAQ